METKIIMKAGVVICTAILCLCMSSCADSEDALVREVGVSEILVEESPWVFSRYENSFILEDGGLGFSRQEIEDDMNQYIIGVSFTFHADGTGFIDVPEQSREEWVWSLSGNRLTTTTNSQTDQYTFFSADRNQMTFESSTTTLHFKDSVAYQVTHVGKYFFK